jgi:UTP--glucose-1-phosphate uridylyltransferase
MLPAAKAIPKEMLPILDRPAIQYIVEEAAAAGIDDVLLVTSRSKRAIEDHFDRDLDLESRLTAAGKLNLLNSLKELTAKVKIHSTRQGEMRGLGHAVAQARKFCGNEPFLCMLGDALFSGGQPARQLVEAYSEFQTPIIGLEEVPLEKVGRYGIAAGAVVRPGVIRIESLFEKPKPGVTASRLAIAARYVLTPAIFECLDLTTPGAGGEIQLTDALQRLLARQPIHGIILTAHRHDIGDPADWLATNLNFAAADPQLKRRLQPVIQSLLNG